MPTFTSPIKPLILAIALGFSQYGLAKEPSSCDAIVIIDALAENDSDALTTFDEAWTYVSNCPESASYAIQFDYALNNTTIELTQVPYELADNKNISLSIQESDIEADPAPTPITLQSSDVTKNIFLISSGSKLTTDNIIQPSEVFDCTSPFVISSLVNDEYDGQLSFDNAWDYINVTCPASSDYEISFDSSFNNNVLTLNNSPYKLGLDRTITIKASEALTLSSVNAGEALFAQSNGAVLSSDSSNDNLVLNDSASSSITFTKVILPSENLACASSFTIDSLVEDTYDFEHSFDEVWNLIVNECPGSTEYTINFNSSFNDQPLELASYPYTVNDTRIINISASTASPLTIESGATALNSNIFSVSAGSQLTLSGLIFDGKQITDRTASAITSAGSDAQLTLTNITMRGFYATQDAKGAAISTSSPTIITNSTFEDNQASLQGGAIRVSSADLTITKTSFTNNSTVLASDNNTDASGNSDAGGGAIAFVNHLNDDGNALLISEGTFTNNQALGFGGAILLRGANTVSISDTSFTTNNVNSFTASGVTQSYGGAIAFDRQADISIETSVFDANTAQLSGGAIYVGNLKSDGTLTVGSSNLINNTAIENGAAIYLDATENYTTSITQTSINTNDAIGNGGGIYVHEKLLTLSIENATISTNSANQGAGIYFDNAVVDGSSINYSTIVNNTSTSGGGVIQATASPVVALSHDIISANTGLPRQVCVTNSQTGFSIAHSFINELSTEDENNCLDYIADGNIIEPEIDPLLVLAPLASNGGLGATHYPAENSPVIDTGDTTLESTPDFDQRGSSRVIRGIVDIGAVEFGNLAVNAQTIENVTISPENNYSLSISSFFTTPTGDSLTYSITGVLPEGLTFTGNTISGKPVHEVADTLDTYNTITVIATSNNNGLVVARSSFTMTVGYSAPVYEGLTSLAVNVNNGLQWNLAKSTDVDNQTITYSLSGLPAGLTFNENNFVTGRTTLAMVANSPYSLELKSKDLYDETTTQITLKIVDPNDVVVITDTESGAASLNPWLLMGLTLVGLGGFRRRQAL